MEVRNSGGGPGRKEQGLGQGGRGRQRLEAMAENEVRKGLLCSCHSRLYSLGHGCVRWHLGPVQFPGVSSS